MTERRFLCGLQNIQIELCTQCLRRRVGERKSHVQLHSVTQTSLTPETGIGCVYISVLINEMY